MGAAVDEEQKEQSRPVVAALQPNSLVGMLASLAAVFGRISPSTERHEHTHLDTVCYCLVVDPMLLESRPEDKRLYLESLAIAASSDRGQRRSNMQQHIVEWMKGAATNEDISIGYVEKSSELHINFINQTALAKALAFFPFLVRCGSTGSAWRNSNCGMKKDKLPELIRMTCIPTTPKHRNMLDQSVKQLLADQQVEHTAFWYSSASDSGGRGQQQQQQRQGRELLIINILPRHIEQTRLRATIEQLHNKVEIWGGKLRAHCPNIGELARCNQCDQLGHLAAHCDLYQGLAVRLLMRMPIPYQAMEQLVSSVRARVGYLGSGVDEFRPSRRVTLLFFFFFFV